MFPPGKRQIVHEDLSQNFMFYGDETLFKHILFNLLKNSFYFIDKVRKGEIYIWLEPGDKYNELHFKDTAQGVSEEDLPHIFEQFFTKGTIMGLGLDWLFVKQSWSLGVGKLPAVPFMANLSSLFADFLGKIMPINMNDYIM